MNQVHEGGFDVSRMRSHSATARVLIVLLASALLWLFMVASQHHHATDDEDNDCAICSAVVHHVVDLTAAPAIAAPIAAAIYYVESVKPVVLASAFEGVCPPICGPPSPSLTKQLTTPSFR
jgi:hypothetical protein